MKKIIFLSISLIVFCMNADGQNMWNKISMDRLSQKDKMDRNNMPSKYELYSLDMSILKSKLIQAPADLSGLDSNVIIQFPNEDGVLQDFKVYESSIMEVGLAEKFPEIKTYLARGVDDTSASMRFSITPFGLHTMTFSGISGTTFIDTFTKDLSSYIVYNKSSVNNTRGFDCLFAEANRTEKKDITTSQKNSDSKFRIYRLAMACTGEYAAFHGGTVALAQAAEVVTVNRVNLLYERDLSVRLVLVANNSSILFTNAATDPYTNNNGNTLLGQNQTRIDAVIGNANYDIGHVASTGGGGVAGLGVVCITGQKARGVTGLPAPIGDPYDIDYVAHEMGHQFGCDHTFNSVQSSCGGGNRNASTAVEPGSGTTIMAYAGICSPDNVQPNSDSHFSFISIQEAESTILSSATCATITSNGNFPPVVNAGLDYTIPNGTPFILKGSAIDANGDTLLYCWEQTDLSSITTPPAQTDASGPVFRSRPPVVSPNRYIPALSSVIANNLAPAWEVVPNVARVMNFALTVRDNRTVTANGGQTSRDDMVVTTAAVGPFLVTAPNTALSWIVGSNQTVTWDVAGTTANGINAKYVDILLSTDGGNTYPILLASKVPNDGSEVVTVSNNVGTTNRVMVRGNNHIFYDISNANFTITAPSSSFDVAFTRLQDDQYRSNCQGSNVSYTFNYTALAGFVGSTTFAATGNPAGSIVAFTPTSASANTTVAVTISNTASSPIGLYNLLVNATSGATTKTVPFYFELFSSVFPAMSLTTPINNATNQSTIITLNWLPNSNASSYDVQVATDNTFTNIISSSTVSSTNYDLSGLAVLKDYYWRILPKNINCNGTFSAPNKFTTGQTLCQSTISANVPVNISASGTSTVNSTLNVPFAGTISDVNVSMNVSHSYLGDIALSLIGPSGTTINLFTNSCMGSDNVVGTFDDSGVALVCGANPGVLGAVIPVQSLSAFNGQNPSGIWTLRVVDNADGDGGAINSWSVSICSFQPTLSLEDNQFEGFALFPNPNNGEFTLKLNSDSSNDIKVNIHDMRGREVYTKSYSNSGAFNQNINLDNVQGGIYLISVSDGNRKSVKRIVIQ
jgi:subtilisin-like proprotein convertase family protein